MCSTLAYCKPVVADTSEFVTTLMSAYASLCQPVFQHQWVFGVSPAAVSGVGLSRVIWAAMSARLLFPGSVSLSSG